MKWRVRRLVVLGARRKLRSATRGRRRPHGAIEPRRHEVHQVAVEASPGSQPCGGELSPRRRRATSGLPPRSSKRGSTAMRDGVARSFAARIASRSSSRLGLAISGSLREVSYTCNVVASASDSRAAIAAAVDDELDLSAADRGRRGDVAGERDTGEIGDASARPAREARRHGRVACLREPPHPIPDVDAPQQPRAHEGTERAKDRRAIVIGREPSREVRVRQRDRARTHAREYVDARGCRPQTARTRSSARSARRASVTSATGTVDRRTRARRR